MSSGYSAYHGAYINNGPLVFKPQIYNQIPSGTAANSPLLVQNYPFIDNYQNILTVQSISGNNITINADVTSSNSFYLTTDICYNTASSLQLATVGYTQYEVSQWSLDQAVCDVQLGSYSVKDISAVVFMDVSSTTLSTFTDASQNHMLAVSGGNGIYFETTQAFILEHSSQSNIRFTDSGEIYFTSTNGTAQGSNVVWSPTSGMYLDSSGLLHANLAAPSIDISYSFGNSLTAPGQITYTCTNGVSQLPTQLSLPTLVVNSASQLGVSTVNGLPSITSITATPGLLPSNFFMYNTTIYNADVSNSIYLDAGALNKVNIGTNWTGSLQIAPLTAQTVFFTKDNNLYNVTGLQYILSAFAINSNTPAGFEPN